MIIFDSSIGKLSFVSESHQLKQFQSVVNFDDLNELQKNSIAENGFYSLSENCSDCRGAEFN